VCSKYMIPENIILSERSPTQKAGWYTTPLIQNVHTRQICREDKLMIFLA
jgi:hypothetical protein